MFLFVLRLFPESFFDRRKSGINVKQGVEDGENSVFSMFCLHQCDIFHVNCDKSKKFIYSQVILFSLSVLTTKMILIKHEKPNEKTKKRNVGTNFEKVMVICALLLK